MKDPILTIEEDGEEITIYATRLDAFLASALLVAAFFALLSGLIWVWLGFVYVFLFYGAMNKFSEAYFEEHQKRVRRF